MEHCRSVKSYLLFQLFREYLKNEQVPDDHIIEMSFDAYENKEVVISVAALIMVCTYTDSSGLGNMDTQYVLYLGTNDKDTNQPVFTPEDAKKEAEKILTDYFGGYTIQEANGGWIYGDTEYQDYTLVIYLSDTDIEHIHYAADEMIETFHQSSVLIQANQTTTEFYSGKN